jgi:hypothetical protein
VGDSQSQKAGEGSTLIQAGGNVSIGLSYADIKLIISEEQERIVEHVWNRAREVLREAGIQPGPVPLKILVSLLQNASLEEDEALQERWANLLANAATDVKRFRSFFPRALAQLGSVEARLLDFMNDHAVQGANNASVTPAEDLKRHDFSVLHAAYRTIVKSTVPPYTKASMDELGEVLAVLNVLIAQGMVRTQGDYGGGPNHCSYRITSLGLEFVSACRQPKKGPAE